MYNFRGKFYRLSCADSGTKGQSMPLYQYKAIRKSDGAELKKDTILDALNAGLKPMKLAVIAGLLHAHPEAKGLTYHDIRLEMARIG